MTIRIIQKDGEKDAISTFWSAKGKGDTEGLSGTKDVKDRKDGHFIVETRLVSDTANLVNGGVSREGINGNVQGHFYAGGRYEEGRKGGL